MQPIIILVTRFSTCCRDNIYRAYIEPLRHANIRDALKVVPSMTCQPTRRNRWNGLRDGVFGSSVPRDFSFDLLIQIRYVVRKQPTAARSLSLSLPSLLFPSLSRDCLRAWNGATEKIASRWLVTRPIPRDSYTTHLRGGCNQIRLTYFLGPLSATSEDHGVLQFIWNDVLLR